MAGRTLEDLKKNYTIRKTVVVEPYLEFELEAKVCNGNLVFLKLPDNKYYSKMEISSLKVENVGLLPITNDAMTDLCDKITAIQYDIDP